MIAPAFRQPNSETSIAESGRAGEPAEQGQRGDCRARTLAIQPPRAPRTRHRRGPRPCRCRARARRRYTGRLCASARPINPRPRKTALIASTRRPPSRWIPSPTRGETMPATRRPSDRPPTTHASGQPVSARSVCQHREQIVGRAPGKNLRYTEDRDDGAQIRPVMQWKCLGGRSTYAATPQPHPVFPCSLATASARQHASAVPGAGPPQHPAAPLPSAENVVVQTPVSGSTS